MGYVGLHNHCFCLPPRHFYHHRRHRTQSQSPIVFPNVHNYQFVFCLCELVSQNFWIWFLSLMFLNFIPFNDWIQWCLCCFLFLAIVSSTAVDISTALLVELQFLSLLGAPPYLMTLSPLSAKLFSIVQYYRVSLGVVHHRWFPFEKRNQTLYPIWWVESVDVILTCIHLRYEWSWASSHVHVGCLSIHLGKRLFKRHLFKAAYGSTYVSSQHSEQSKQNTRLRPSWTT